MDTSVLELRVGGLPFPHGGSNGEWRYRHAVRADGPTALDRQVVVDFLTCERQHGRQVEVLADPGLAGCESWEAPEERPHPGDGVHPVKIHGTLRLEEVSVAVIVHARDRHLVADGARKLRRRMVVLDLEQPSPAQWASAANAAADEIV